MTLVTLFITWFVGAIFTAFAIGVIDALDSRPKILFPVDERKVVLTVIFWPIVFPVYVAAYLVYLVVFGIVDLGESLVRKVRK